MGTTVCDHGRDTATRTATPARSATQATAASRAVSGVRANRSVKCDTVTVSRRDDVPVATDVAAVQVGAGDAPLRRPDEFRQLPDGREFPELPLHCLDRRR